MKFLSVKNLLVILVIISAGLVLAQLTSPKARGGAAASVAQPNSGNPGFAVVELFTSEGCSSCPPADALLGEILKDAQQSNRPIYPIAFHIDYWDQLGWRDPFSTQQASIRQGEYARALNSTEVYTPQMIVNGRVEFIGSDKARAQQEIDAALSQPAKIVLALQPSKDSSNHLSIGFTLNDEAAGNVLNVIAVERGLVVSIPRGENGGRTLHHDNVARAFARLVLTRDRAGKISLTLPVGINEKNTSLIGFVQDPSSLQILGATGAQIPTVATTQPAKQ